MKILWAFFVLIIASGIAQATYVNDQAFGLGNGAYITVNTTTIDDVNQLACCDNNELMMRINGSMTNYTAGANKTITSVTMNNITDVFTLPVTGTGYLNFSIVMKNASNSYNLTANGVYVESRNTSSGSVVWFNYSGAATLVVSWNSSTGGGSGTLETFMPPTPTSCTAIAGIVWINVSCSVGSGNITNGMNFSKVSPSSWQNGSQFYQNFTGLNEGTTYDFRIYAWNSSSSGTLNASYASVSNTTLTTPAAPTYIPPTPISCMSTNGTTWINVSCSAGSGNVTNFMNFTNTNLGTWNNNSVFYWNNSGLSEGTLYNYRIYAYNNSGILNLTHATASNTTKITPVPPTTEVKINSYSPAAQYNTLRDGNALTFQVISATNVVDYHWTYDDGTVGDATNTYIKTFNINTGGNLHYVKVYGTNGSNMSNTVEWRISIMKALAVAPVATLNESSWRSMNTSINSMDMAGFIVGTMGTYTNVMGNYFYLLLWGIVFVMLWIRQGSITVPSTLGMILGAIVIAMLPSEYQMVAQAMIAMGIIAVIYVMFSERG